MGFLSKKIPPWLEMDRFAAFFVAMTMYVTM